MFIRRTLEIDSRQASLAEPFFPRECFSNVALANAYLERVRAEADALLEQSRSAAARHRTEAEAEFWRRANALLADWERDRQLQRERLVTEVQALLRDTLSELLGSCSAQERAFVLVRQLVNSQTRPVRATLRCAVDVHLHIDAWLLQQGLEHWQLERDEGLADGTLWLSTEQGDFSLDWQALCDRLVDLI